MRIHATNTALLFLLVSSAAAPAQQSSEATGRAEAMATRRAKRHAERIDRMPSRPFTLRDPLPLPVAPALPPGGAPAGEACPADASCEIRYEVPAKRILVVTGLWGARDVRCDGAALGSGPPGGQLVSPWWHCADLLRFEGKGAGFAGYLFSPPAEE